MKVCVVGLGKIGLPLAVQYASKGFSVLGADVQIRTVDLINQGVAPFPGEEGLPEKLSASVHAGLLRATTDTTSAVADCDVVVIVVPLFVDSNSEPEFGWMDDATQAVGRGLRKGTLVAYETTLPIGTTRARFAPMLEAVSGLQCGTDFHLVFSPERVLTGRVFSDLRRYPKLVGGFSATCEDRGVDFYNSVLDFDTRADLPQPNGVWRMGSSEAAEMAKLAETTYRDVNIALSNQLARIADEQRISLRKVIQACNSQPYSQIHQPGIAVGGHCIPIYPQLLLHTNPDASVVRMSRDVNDSMPRYCSERIVDRFGPLNDVRAVILGASYRGGVKETAFSGSYALRDELESRGARVVVHDPLFDDDELRALSFKPYSFGEEIDLAIIQADHQEYRTLSSSDLPGVRMIYDGRNILRHTPDITCPIIRLGEH